MGGRAMASAERQPGGLEAEPPAALPLVEGQEAKPPEAETFLSSFIQKRGHKLRI